MTPSTQKFWTIPAIIVIAALAITVSVYAVHQDQAANNPIPVVTTTPSSSSSSTTTVTIMVPNDLAAYEKATIQFAQQGIGTDPSKTFPFVAMSVAPNTMTADPIRNAAEAAAEVIPTQAGTSSLVAYFKVVNGTAYVLLNMDLNGWAGVSVAIAEVHPLVQKTLLAQPGITAVVFGPAPGDTMSSIEKAYEEQSDTASKATTNTGVVSTAPATHDCGAGTTWNGSDCGPIASSSQPPTIVLSPNGGETISLAEGITVSFIGIKDAGYSVNLVNNTTQHAYNLNGLPNPNSNPHIIATGVAQSLTVSAQDLSKYDLPLGSSYKIELCTPGPTDLICDYSDNYFTITN